MNNKYHCVRAARISAPPIYFRADTGPYNYKQRLKFKTIGKTRFSIHTDFFLQVLLTIRNKVGKGPSERSFWSAPEGIDFIRACLVASDQPVNQSACCTGGALIKTKRQLWRTPFGAALLRSERNKSAVIIIKSRRVIAMCAFNKIGVFPASHKSWHVLFVFLYTEKKIEFDICMANSHTTTGYCLPPLTSV